MASAPRRQVITEIHAVSVNDGVIIGFPGELYARCAAQARAGSGFAHTLVASCVNDHIGCIRSERDARSRAAQADPMTRVYARFQFAHDVAEAMTQAALLERVSQFAW